MATRPRVAVPSEATASTPRYINRELSTLDFIERVLALAADPSVPLLERVKFIAIVAGSLDELFGVRVAGLQAQAATHR
ncbi:MAG: RNA degradosome polyphosphate kinase, partial [Chloroflexi bacterium]|nr:RNA degradosome polyphosphate kinase [Chloroflexota bacterium]